VDLCLPLVELLLLISKYGKVFRTARSKQEANDRQRNW